MQGAGDAHSSNLRPGWNRVSGGGFQPPPPAAEEGETRSRNNTSRGRSLADLARTSLPNTTTTTSTTSTTTHTTTTTNTGTSLSSSNRWPSQPTAAAVTTPTVPAGPRYTREKLLSLRPPTNGTPPAELDAEICSEEAQDPVCWDTFEAETIWTNATRQRKVSAERSSRRDVTTGSSARWKRGVALPTATDIAASANNNSKTATAAEDLWDDPGDELDFESMAAASAQMEHELRGPKDTAEDMVDEVKETKSVETILAARAVGSGDHVNVFQEDAPLPPPQPIAETIEEPEPAPLPQPEPVIKKATLDEAVDDSSRLMAMIGVSKNEEPSLWGISATVPQNPWGAPTPSSIVADKAAAAAAEEQRLRQAEELRRRREEEQQLRVQADLRRQAEEQQRQHQEILRMKQEEARRKEEARQVAAAAQAPPSEVELVLMERISTILESQWGHSDLVSILSLLHAEDSRVIALLGSVDALRALIRRHPRRVEIRPDPARRAEIAQLLLTNAQYRQEQERQHREQLMQEEQLRRRVAAEEQKRLERQLQMAAPNIPPALPPVDPNAPWYYSDPSRIIQGPFRAEEMRQWLEAGYFKGDLPIAQNPSGPFAVLSRYFPNMTRAFKKDIPTPVPTPEPHVLIEEPPAPVHAAPLPEPEVTQESIQVQESISIDDSPSIEEPAHTPKDIPAKQPKPKNGGDHNATENKANKSSSSAQLKMMLGLANSGGNGMKAPVPVTAPVVQPKKPAAAWGGAAKPTARKSMSEIQQEEAAAAAKRGGGNNNNNNNGSGGWAKIAASTTWSGPAVAPTTAANPSPPVRPGNGPTRSASIAIHQQQTAPIRTQKVPSRSKSVSDAVAFGAKIPRGLEDWAKEQMIRLNGTEDLTLVSFCMSLQDPEEIHQYLTVYLGPSKEVTQFANELIARKADDWESTATRKGRKTKGGR